MLLSGVYLAPRGMISLSLPMTEADFDGLIAAVEEFLDLHAPLL